MGVIVVVANLGFGGPGPLGSIADVRRWIDRLEPLEPSVLLLQEMPRYEWWDVELSGRGWQLIDGCGRAYRCRSGVAVRRPMTAKGVELKTGGYHGSYLAAADVDVPEVGRLTVVSVHASPTALTAADEALWQGPPPRLRRGGRNDPPVWDSDHVLQTLADLVPNGRLLAGGDLNEARAWDDDHAGHWGEDWFAFACEAGLHDLLHTAWDREQPTRGRYQADHVLATADVVPWLQTASFGPPPPSDHKCIVVALKP